MCRKNSPDNENIKNQIQKGMILMDHTNKNIWIPNLPPDLRRQVQCILYLSQPQDHEPA